MQWSGDPNGGFSDAPAEALIRPVVTGGAFDYRRVNAATQQRDSASLLNRVERMIRVRKEHPEFGWGAWKPVDARGPGIFAIRAEFEGRVVLAVHNLSRRPGTAKLDLPAGELAALHEILSDSDYAPPDGKSPEIQLEGYGYRWFRLGARGL
jgi:maltose alpha-D-glucosyltransferase/alpha-amylase